ncbi:MAG: alpha/beta fold hydrolase [Hungatella sp.]|jgi:pimeloyl-ACP methyl ester carboxylesterase|nr:alpha/beta fold hydrolase [Hungatella sp.]
MTTKNKLITASILSSSSIAAISLINKCIKISATSKSLLDKSQMNCFHWRMGNIYYTTSGSGKPLLLVHDLDSAASSYEWHKIRSALEKKYTVYSLDLLGCGESEKPCLTYTNYLYVQLISDFIKSVIGHRTDVISSGASGSFMIMACSNNPDLFDRIMLINPDSINICSQLPGPYSKYYKRFLDFPIIGTLLYHIAVSKSSLRKSFTDCYFTDPKAVKESIIDTYYESAHLGFSPKSVYACVRCNYVNCNISNALKKIDNSIYLIGGEKKDQIKDIFLEYVDCNPAIEYSLISDTKHLPHMEKPAELLANIHTFFS